MALTRALSLRRSLVMSSRHVRSGESDTSDNPPMRDLSVSESRRVTANIHEHSDCRAGLRSASPEAVQTLLRHRIAEMRRDGDELCAIPLLDPRSHRLDRMSERVGADFLGAAVLR